MHTLIAGFGSQFGADTLGWQVVDALAESKLPNVILRKYRHPSAVLGELAEFDRVFFVDALRSAEHNYGELLEFPATGLKSSNGLFSSHAQGLNDAIALARALAILPHNARVLGVNVYGAESRRPPDGGVDAAVQFLLSLLVQKSASQTPG